MDLSCVRLVDAGESTDRRDAQRCELDAPDRRTMQAAEDSPQRVRRIDVLFSKREQQDRGDPTMRRDVQRPPGIVRGLVQAWQHSVGFDIWPQRVNHTVAMQPGPRCQCEELHHGGSGTARPLVAGHLHTVDADGEGAQQPYLDRHCRILLPVDG
jgi:hypothetical protein